MKKVLIIMMLCMGHVVIVNSTEHESLYHPINDFNVGPHETHEQLIMTEGDYASMTKKHHPSFEPPRGSANSPRSSTGSAHSFGPHRASDGSIDSGKPGSTRSSTGSNIDSHHGSASPYHNFKDNPDYVEPGNPISRNDESIAELRKKLESAEQEAIMLNKLLKEPKLKENLKEKELREGKLNAKLSVVNKIIERLKKDLEIENLEIKEMLVTLEKELALLTNPKNPNPAKSPSGQKP